MEQRPELETPSSDEVRSALERLLLSPQFAASPRASRFLRFVVTAALEGRQQTLKEYVLGVEVFDRAPGFDPAVDTIVRVEAVKLRKRLDAYYLGPGRSDPVVISVPKGAYVPQFRLNGGAGATVTNRLSDPVSVAVLPFANLSPDAANEFWSDGLTDELTSLLSRVSRLRVVSRTSAAAFKGKPMDVRAIGSALGAAMLVEGSVRRQEDRVRIAAQLTEVESGLHLWSGTLEREARDAWAVQQEIARAVVEAIHVELTSSEERRMARRHTDSASAFELYLQGCHALARFEVPSQREALALFERACAADSGYPLPLLGAARSWMNLAVLGVERPRDVAPRAKEALRKALSLDPAFAEAHSLLASVICRHEWDWAEAEKHHRIALRLAPNAAEVHDEYATTFLAPKGRIEEALAENRIARQLDPFSPQLARSYVLILMLARRLPDAERECRRILDERPQDGYVRLILALALHGQRRIQQALAEYERVYADDPTVQHEAYVADIRTLFGDRRPAEELLCRLRARVKSEFVPAMVFVWLHLHLGEIEEALTALEQAYENREYELLVAKTGYGFDAFRQQPRFRAIIDKLGLD